MYLWGVTQSDLLLPSSSARGQTETETEAGFSGRPPEFDQELGRPEDELVQIYIEECGSSSGYKKLSDGIYTSTSTRLSLTEYVQARQKYCMLKHEPLCLPCEQMLKVAKNLYSMKVTAGCQKLSALFHQM